MATIVHTAKPEKFEVADGFAILTFLAFVATLILGGFHFVNYDKVEGAGMWSLVSFAVFVAALVTTLIMGSDTGSSAAYDTGDPRLSNTFFAIGIAALVVAIVLVGFYSMAYGTIPDSGMWASISLVVCIAAFIVSGLAEPPEPAGEDD